jgi:hypothetical protein
MPEMFVGTGLGMLLAMTSSASRTTVLVTGVLLLVIGFVWSVLRKDAA